MLPERATCLRSAGYTVNDNATEVSFTESSVDQLDVGYCTSLRPT
jgi:hypothetical protein